ncbi:SDR family oxidoreductase [Methylobacterium gnaphalii]|uniref:Saccharopine dehydrogenase n=1 Tax=Methylobacterium gnaphalii TaxID=1010610 RepID=A0A512JHY0_9HYPH|nr:SDR family oxidoreductase [Methylobacterium gnaphalii]GEP09554.1 hypothetical protein MGN01_13990 [Methylobacterium gnaphalii]GJD69928.1 hypothetical protein MMMDOFMJ_2867 [Methylobacterium gnaphalii]GLS48148.1 hypothetical protein GCM10007885_09920 [Methylobacterium gnaphalii]
MSERFSEPAVLIVGGSGAFGSRLVAGLVETTTLPVIIAGRNLARAEATARLHPPSRVQAIRLDAATVAACELTALGLRLVVDAAGPFQGAEPRLARAAIAAGLPYLDLADARDFVSRFGRLDAEARAAVVVALTGASSTPALSNAALDAITAGWRRVEAISVAIVPGNRAPRGLSVMKAILSYAGRPVRVFRDGAWEREAGWSLLSRLSVHGLGRRWASLCETPDLDILPARFPEARSAIFRAGLELSVLHLGLWLASLPVRLRLLPSLVPFAKPFLAVTGWLERFGSDRGGMVVEALGRDADDRPTRARWSLVAEAGDGPYVPTLPALAMIRRMTDPAAEPVPPGARAYVDLLSLTAIEAEMRRLRIETRIVSDHPTPLLVRALGAGFATMPAPIQTLHGATGGLSFSGEAEVQRGMGMTVAPLAALFRLPHAMTACPVRVAIRPGKGTERWTRRFGGERFSSVMSLAPGGEGRGMLRERFGPFSMDLAVIAHAEGLDMAITGWRIGLLRLPRALSPATRASERVDERGRFRFDVALFLPLVGLLVHYRGWLLPEWEEKHG